MPLREKNCRRKHYQRHQRTNPTNDNLYNRHAGVLAEKKKDDEKVNVERNE
jgi:hypothetical protein